MAERESPERWAGTASRPRVTSQHHVTSSLLEKLSSCLACPELGIAPGPPALSLPVCRGDGHHRSAGIAAGFGPWVGTARVPGASAGCDGVSRAPRTPKLEVPGSQPSVASGTEARRGAGGVGMPSR